MSDLLTIAAPDLSLRETGNENSARTGEAPKVGKAADASFAAALADEAARNRAASDATAERKAAASAKTSGAEDLAPEETRQVKADAISATETTHDEFALGTLTADQSEAAASDDNAALGGLVTARQQLHEPDAARPTLPIAEPHISTEGAAITRAGPTDARSSAAETRLLQDGADEKAPQGQALDRAPTTGDRAQGAGLQTEGDESIARRPANGAYGGGVVADPESADHKSADHKSAENGRPLAGAHPSAPESHNIHLRSAASAPAADREGAHGRAAGVSAGPSASASPLASAAKQPLHAGPDNPDTARLQAEAPRAAPVSARTGGVAAEAGAATPAVASQKPAGGDARAPLPGPGTTGQTSASSEIRHATATESASTPALEGLTSDTSPKRAAASALDEGAVSPKTTQTDRAGSEGAARRTPLAGSATPAPTGAAPDTAPHNDAALQNIARETTANADPKNRAAEPSMAGRAHAAHAALAVGEEAPLSPDAQFRAARQAHMDRTPAEQSRTNAEPRGETDSAARSENASAQQKPAPAQPAGPAQKNAPPPTAASGAAGQMTHGPAAVLSPLPPPFLHAQFALPPGSDPLDAMSAHGGALDPAAAGLVKPKVSAAQSPRAFVAEIARIIGRRGAAGARQFDIRLDPPELGRIDVKLKFSADGKMRAHLVFDRQDALDMVQRDAKTLERVLQQDGFSLDGDALEFSTREFEGFASDEKGGDGEDGREERDGRNGDDPDLSETAPRQYVDLRYGVDIRI